MRFTVSSKVFIEALKPAVEAIGTKSSHPILTHVKVVASAEAGTITICGTDLRLTVIAEINENVGVVRSGETTIPSKLLADIVSSINGDITLTLNDGENTVVLTHPSGEYKINVMGVDEFPSVDSFEVNHVIVGDFAKSFKQALQAVSDDETKRILCGIRVKYHKNDDIFDLGATTGHFAIKKGIQPTVVETKKFDECVIPSKCVKVAIKYATDKMELHIGDRYVKILVNNITLIAPLLDGTYPNLESLIRNKKDSTSAFLINPKKLYESIERLSVVDKSNPIVFNFGDGSLQIKRLSQDVCDGNETLGIEQNIGSLEVAFNCRYLKDIINEVKHLDDVCFGFQQPTSPCLIDHGDWICLLMPVKIN